jgi:UDP:flavonoid glycosyltransferase YjiC (YdhE family)
LVRLVTHANFAPLVTSRGLAFWPMGGDVRDVAQSPEMRQRIGGGNLLAVLSLMAKEAERAALILADAGLAASQGMDLVVAGIGGLFVGLAMAEKLRIPLMQAYYIPFTPTRAYPSFLAPRLPSWLGRGPNRLTHHAARQVMWQGFRRADRRIRAEVLGLPPAPFFGPYASGTLKSTPLLYGYSPAVIPKPPDWEDDIHVTGYWFLDPADDWSPPPDLVSFLDAGAPPVYVGFGSMAHREPEKTVDLIVQALARSGQRAVLGSGWGGLGEGKLPQTVFRVDSVPFSWLFPRMAAVVHHGGAGTTAAGLRAGVPSVVVPFFGDQFYWGQRIVQLGVGPEPVPRKGLTAGRLAEAMEAALTDGAIRERAADLGATIRAEDGVGKAVAVVEGFLGEGG